MHRQRGAVIDCQCIVRPRANPCRATVRQRGNQYQRTGIAEVMGSNPVEALIFFRLLLSNCLNWKIYCDDHTSLSSTTAVQI